MVGEEDAVARQRPEIRGRLRIHEFGTHAIPHDDHDVAVGPELGERGRGREQEREQSEQGAHRNDEGAGAW